MTSRRETLQRNAQSHKQRYANTYGIRKGKKHKIQTENLSSKMLGEIINKNIYGVIQFGYTEY